MPGPQRVGVEGRRVDGARPVRLGGRDALRAAVVEDRVVEGAGAHGGVELRRSSSRARRRPARACRRARARVLRLLGREHRRHELAHRLGVDDRIADLAGLPGHQPPPDGVALGPEVLALVVEALRVAVDDDAQRHRVDAGDDAAVVARAARVDGHAVALRRVAHAPRALVEQELQHLAHVVGRAAHDEVVGGRPPRLAQPLEVGLEPAGGHDDRPGADLAALALALDGDRVDAPPASARSTTSVS